MPLFIESLIKYAESSEGGSVFKSNYNTMKIILLTGLLIAAFSCNNVKGQSISFEKERGVVLHLIGVDQHGDQVTFDPPEEMPLVLFFLPKTDSRNEAELYMGHVTNFFENLSEYRRESINGVFIVEPMRSGPLVNRIFRSWVSDKPFPVIRDADGEITGKVHNEAYSIMAWVVDRNGEIIHITTEPFTDSGNQKLREMIEDITNKGPQN